MPNTDLIIFTMSRFDDPYSSTIFSLAKELSARRRVFYIDHPFTVKDALLHFNKPQIQNRRTTWLTGNKRYRKLNDQLTVVIPPPTLPINWLPTGEWYARAAAWSEQKMQRLFRQLLADFEIEEYVFINSFNPFFLQQLPADRPPKLYVYQTTDDLSQAPYVAKHGVGLEQQLFARADVVLATSQALRDYAANYAQQVHLLPNAADVSFFNTAYTETLPRPNDLKSIEKPIVLYVGNVSYLRMDFALLKQLATDQADKHFVFIGPIDSEVHREYGLHEQPNVSFLGGRPFSEMPAYLQHSQCCIIPFLCNQLTQSIYPLKINEYLAAAKPVVTTPFSPDIRRFKLVVKLASDAASFGRAIEEAISTDSKAKQRERMAVAAQNSWAARAEQLEELLAIKNYELRITN